LDDTLSEAHVAIATVEGQWDWDWASSETHGRRAIDLEPSSSVAHTGLAVLMMNLRRNDEAIESARWAHALDPLNPTTKLTYVQALSRGKRYDEALPLLHEALEIVPGNVAALLNLFRINLAQGRHDEALAALDRQDAAIGVQDEKLEEYRRVRETEGFTGAMEWRARQPELSERPEYMWTYRAALFYCLAGKCDRAMPYLEKAHESRCPELPKVYADRAFDPLRSNPDFRNLLRRMNFPVD
jgi:tetratricopeptide (TPR) repeat protein